MQNKNIKNAVKSMRRGEIIILVDDKERENEGDFVQASEWISPQSVNFMITHGRGLLCQSITSKRAEALRLGWQAKNNTSLHATAFTVSVDAKNGTTTGISVSDRVITIKALVDSSTKPEDLAIPGHVFPIVAHDGGVLARPGHTEGSIELARLAGCKPNAIICEVLNEEGSAANEGELIALAQKFDLCIVHIQEIVEYLQGEYHERN